MAISVQFRKGRKRWGYAGFHLGKRYTKFAWAEKAEAETAYHRFMLDVGNSPSPEVENNCLSIVAREYIDDSAFRERSAWRIKALRWTFNKWILPYFGDLTRVTDITSEDLEKFIHAQKARGVKNSTIWHYVTDLRAMFNWAIKQTRRWEATKHKPKPSGAPYGVTVNPVQDTDLSKIKNRKVVKRAFDPNEVERAAEALSGQDRYYFDALRYTGMRKDEANRLQWTDLDLEHGIWVVPGTKTEDSLARLPLAPIIQRQLQALKGVSEGCQWVFPGQSEATHGQKVYGRTRMFEKIYNKTGIKLTPKDLRDYFASEVSSKVQDPNVIMRLLRHTNLTTTTKYLRVVEDRMAEAVKGIGGVI